MRRVRRRCRRRRWTSARTATRTPVSHRDAIGYPGRGLVGRDRGSRGDPAWSAPAPTARHDPSSPSSSLMRTPAEEPLELSPDDVTSGGRAGGSPDELVARYRVFVENGRRRRRRRRRGEAGRGAEPSLVAVQQEPVRGFDVQAAAFSPRELAGWPRAHARNRRLATPRRSASSTAERVRSGPSGRDRRVARRQSRRRRPIVPRRQSHSRHPIVPRRQSRRRRLIVPRLILVLRRLNSRGTIQ